MCNTTDTPLAQILAARLGITPGVHIAGTQLRCPPTVPYFMCGYADERNGLAMVDGTNQGVFKGHPEYELIAGRVTDSLFQYNPTVNAVKGASIDPNFRAIAKINGRFEGVADNPDYFQRNALGVFKAETCDALTFAVNPLMSYRYTVSFTNEQWHNGICLIPAPVYVPYNNPLVLVNGHPLIENFHWVKQGQDILLTTREFASATEQVVTVLYRPQVTECTQVGLIVTDASTPMPEAFNGLVLACEGTRKRIHPEMTLPDGKVASIEITPTVTPLATGGWNTAIQFEPFVKSLVPLLPEPCSNTQQNLCFSPFLWSMLKKLKSVELYQLEALSNRATCDKFLGKDARFSQVDPLFTLPEKIKAVTTFTATTVPEYTVVHPQIYDAFCIVVKAYQLPIAVDDFVRLN